MTTEHRSGSARRMKHHEYYPEKHISSRFGVRLRTLREERQLSQGAIAARCGIDRTYISNLERGRQTATLNLLYVLATGLGVDLAKLLETL